MSNEQLKAFRLGGRLVGPGTKSFLVAEIGGNHNGQPDKASRLVKAAQESGADAVKFQAYQTAGFISYLNPYYDELSAEELDFEDLARLAHQAHRLNLAVGLTIFDDAGLTLAQETRADFVKISSGDLTNVELLAQAGESGRVVFLSTGAGDETEVSQALAALAPARSRLILMQCAALYPAPLEAANLGVMSRWLLAGLAAGYSDHVLGLEAAKMAVALGAVAVEKHFTLDRNWPGGDNSISANPEDFQCLSNWAETCLILKGQSQKCPHPLELPMRPLIRRAVVAARNLPAGHKLTGADLALRRPPLTDDLIGPSDQANLLGLILLQDMPQGSPLSWALVAGDQDRG